MMWTPQTLHILTFVIIVETVFGQYVLVGLHRRQTRSTETLDEDRKNEVDGDIDGEDPGDREPLTTPPAETTTGSPEDTTTALPAEDDEPILKPEAALKKAASVLVRECQERAKMPDIDIEEFKKGSLPASAESKCFLGCVQQFAGYLAGNNGVSGSSSYRRGAQLLVNVFYGSTTVPQRKVERMAVRCARKYKSAKLNRCDAGFKAFQCFLASANRKGIPVPPPSSA